MKKESSYAKQAFANRFLFSFSCLPAQVGQIVEFSLTPTIGDWEFATALNEVASETAPTKVHVNVNTGMNRSGVCRTEALQFLSRLKTLQRLEVEGIFTHLATADEVDKSFVSVQLKRLVSVLAHNNGKMVHVANSAATLAVPESHFDAVRPGLGLYGIYPAAEKPILTKTCAYMEGAHRLGKHYFKRGGCELRVDIQSTVSNPRGNGADRLR